MKLIPLTDSVDMLFVEKKNFNTTIVSFNFYLPDVLERASENAMLAYLLSSCSQEYETFSEINLQLNKLYGADLVASVDKIGDSQHIKLAISVIDDKYAMDGESIVKSAVDMLMSLIFSPRVKNGSFFEEDINREKRKLKENILAEINDKRIYARRRLIEQMFENSAYGMSKYGTVESIEALDGERLFDAWKRMLNNAYLRVQVVGASLPDGISDIILDKFSKIQRNDICDYKKSTVLTKREEPKIISESLDVAQGKLVMGFSSEASGPRAYALQIATDIFGGGPYSALFENVREKMSLCYYCSASANKNKAYVMVDSGVELKNVEKAKKEILNQLQRVKDGDFSDFVFNASIKTITGALNSYNDSLSSLDIWYSKNIFDNIVTPEQMAEDIRKLTKEEVVAAANGINLHTIYELLPKGEENAN